MQNLAQTMEALYSGKLKSIDEVKHQQQEVVQEQQAQESDWERTKRIPIVATVLERLKNDVLEALLTVENASLDSSISDAQVRLLLVRYSTLKRTFNKTNNNEE